MIFNSPDTKQALDTYMRQALLPEPYSAFSSLIQASRDTGLEISPLEYMHTCYSIAERLTGSDGEQLYLAGHLRRVAYMSYLLGEQLELSNSFFKTYSSKESLYIQAITHDLKFSQAFHTNVSLRHDIKLSLSEKDALLPDHTYFGFAIPLWLGMPRALPHGIVSAAHHAKYPCPRDSRSFIRELNIPEVPTELIKMLFRAVLRPGDKRALQYIEANLKEIPELGYVWNGIINSRVVHVADVFDSSLSRRPYNNSKGILGTAVVQEVRNMIASSPTIPNYIGVAFEAVIESFGNSFESNRGIQRIEYESKEFIDRMMQVAERQQNILKVKSNLKLRERAVNGDRH